MKNPPRDVAIRIFERLLSVVVVDVAVVAVVVDVVVLAVVTVTDTVFLLMFP